MKFVPADWLKDTRVLSLASKGAWIDILCALWEAQERGILTMPLEGWARYIGASKEETLEVFAELEKYHIFGNVTNGNGEITIKSRRITGEEKYRISVIERQRKYRKEKNVTKVSQESNGQRLDVRNKKLDLDVRKSNPPTPQGVEIPEDLKASETDILEWFAYKRERKDKPFTPLGLKKFWNKLKAMSVEERKQAIEHSMSNNWSGLFSPKGGQNGTPKGAVAGEPGKYAKIGT